MFGEIKMNRAILLADMNSFFASVHQALDPELQGKPVIVAGDPEKRHGIVLTASFEAKKGHQNRDGGLGGKAALP